MKTTAEDLDKVSAYLRNQVGWIETDKIRKAIPAKHASGLKVEAMKVLGLLDRDGNNVKLTEQGRAFANGNVSERARLIAQCLKSVPLYDATLQWMHFSQGGQDAISKTDVANYWHDHHSAETGGAVGDALTDASVFFMRMVGLAGFGKFVAAGAGRDTHLKMDSAALAAFVTGQAAGPSKTKETESAPQQQQLQQPRIDLSGLNVNVEIHIAADAKPATIEEIFKNMRKYLMEPPDAADGR